MANSNGTCTHIRITGVHCGSPALKGEQFCYFHQNAHRALHIAAKNASRVKYKVQGINSVTRIPEYAPQPDNTDFEETADNRSSRQRLRPSKNRTPDLAAGKQEPAAR